MPKEPKFHPLYGRTLADIGSEDDDAAQVPSRSIADYFKFYPQGREEQERPLVTMENIGAGLSVPLPSGSLELQYLRPPFEVGRPLLPQLRAPDWGAMLNYRRQF
jgi:hypothetical protein